VLDELHQPSVVEGVEETTDVGIEHPVHLLRHQPRRERVQRVVLAASRPEPVREAEEVDFADGAQHLDDGALDDFVLQRGDGGFKLHLPPQALGFWNSGAMNARPVEDTPLARRRKTQYTSAPDHHDGRSADRVRSNNR